MRLFTVNGEFPAGLLAEEISDLEQMGISAVRPTRNGFPEFACAMDASVPTREDNLKFR
jgi:hypothetical protein